MVLIGLVTGSCKRKQAVFSNVIRYDFKKSKKLNNLLLRWSFSAYSTSPLENGSKKDLSGDFPIIYTSSEVESCWHSWWEKNGFFRVSPSSDKANSFTMILPPPNVTGTLHLGHALTASIQDAIARWHHMNGEEVLWIPGMDHAGIATQIVVEKQLWKTQKLTRHQLGRDRFLKEVSKYQIEKGSTIKKQLCQMGTVLDWSQEYFTLDKLRSSAVSEAFIQLFEKGLIHRKYHPVNWSCWLRSTISDVEVESREIDGPSFIHVPGYDKAIEFGTLYDIAYKFSDKEGEIVVSTTRPETMLGDVAVAVHPDDSRYKHHLGSYLWHPYRTEKIPLISDKFVDSTFGTGAVKITPAHDRNDFNVSQIHNFKVLPVVEEDGSISQHFETFGGMKRFAARNCIIEDLERRGLLRNAKPHKMILPICSRSGDVVELISKAQWFLSMREVAEEARSAALDGRLRLLPERMNKIWDQWLIEAQDWCLSRQLWWGHSVPAYKCYLSSNATNFIWIAARSEDEARMKASISFDTPVSHTNLKVEQDEDVLDTWFSSSILPLSAFEWPNNVNYKKFYPLSLMETGNDILFFWVARMVMMGLHLTKQLPFNHVLLHGIVRDSSGRKMSKSIGNVVSPEDIRNGKSLQDMMKQVDDSHKSGIISVHEVQAAKNSLCQLFPNGIPACGTDALRFTLCDSDIQTQFIDFNIKNCISNHHFCNKIWQACRYVNGALQLHKTASLKLKDHQHLSAMDRWILSRLLTLVKDVDQGFNDRNLHLCTGAIKRFTIEEFCDVYVEFSKAVVKGNDNCSAHTTLCVLAYCAQTILLTLSPFMPFLSEELYHRMGFLVKNCQSIMQVPFPKPAEFLELQDRTLEDGITIILLAVSAVRKLKLNNGFKNREKVSVAIETSSSNELKIYLNYSLELESLGKCSIVSIKNSSEKGLIPFKEERASDSSTIKIVLMDEHERNLSLKAKEGLILAAVRRRLRIVSEVKNCQKFIQSPYFKTKATKDHQSKTYKELETLEEKLEEVEGLLTQEPELRDRFQIQVTEENQRKVEQKLDKRKNKSKTV